MRATPAVVVVVVIVIVVAVVVIAVAVAIIIVVTVAPRVRITSVIRPGTRCSMGMCIAGGGRSIGGGGSIDSCATHVGMEVGFRGGLLRVGVGVEG